MENYQDYVSRAVELLMSYVPKLALAIVTLFVGLWIIRFVRKWIASAMIRSDIDVSLRRFLISLTGALLKVLLFISVASMIGIATTSFVAILGAAGLAVGFALQGSLANFAGGVLILLFKPFGVGDVIEAQGFIGIVHAIQIFNTVLKSFDNKTIIIPNGPMSNGSIVNYSTEPTRRVDMSFGIGYDDDIRKAREILQRLVAEEKRVLPEPEPAVVLTELGDSSINFAVRVWANAADYWSIYTEMLEKVKYEFDKEGISIPYPQRDVHVYTHKH